MLYLRRQLLVWNMGYSGSLTLNATVDENELLNYRVDFCNKPHMLPAERSSVTSRILLSPHQQPVTYAGNGFVSALYVPPSLSDFSQRGAVPKHKAQTVRLGRLLLTLMATKRTCRFRPSPAIPEARPMHTTVI